MKLREETERIKTVLEQEKIRNENLEIREDKERENATENLKREIERKFASIGNSQNIPNSRQQSEEKDAAWFKREKCRIEKNRELFLEKLDEQSRENGDFKMIGGNTAPLPSRIPTYAEFRNEARSWRAILGNKMKELPVIKMYLETIKISPKDIATAEVLEAEWNRMMDEGLVDHTF